jgi:hypothetical protein
MDKMTELTGKLMINPIAADYYRRLPSSANIETLADKYAQMVAYSDANSEAFCLAIEAHIRHTATVHFHKPEVLQALNTIEKAIKAKRDHLKKVRAAERRRGNAARRLAKKERAS